MLDHEVNELRKFPSEFMGAGAQLGQNLEARAQRAGRVVLVGAGIAEVDEETVTQHLGDLAVEALDHLAAGVLERTHHVLEILEFERLGELRGLDEVAEHDAELPAFAVSRGPLRPGRLGHAIPAQRTSALLAESVAARVRGRAARTAEGSVQLLAAAPAEPGVAGARLMAYGTVHWRLRGKAKGPPSGPDTSTPGAVTGADTDLTP